MPARTDYRRQGSGASPLLIVPPALVAAAANQRQPLRGLVSIHVDGLFASMQPSVTARSAYAFRLGTVPGSDRNPEQSRDDDGYSTL